MIPNMTYFGTWSYYNKSMWWLVIPLTICVPLILRIIFLYRKEIRLCLNPDIIRAWVKSKLQSYYHPPRCDVILDPQRKWIRLNYQTPSTPRSYYLMVPYQYRLVAKLSQLRVHLVRPNEPDLDITQQPGIPYHFTARQLGGTGYRITSMNEGEDRLLGPDELI